MHITQIQKLHRNLLFFTLNRNYDNMKTNGWGNQNEEASGKSNRVGCFLILEWNGGVKHLSKPKNIQFQTSPDIY